MLKFVDDCVVLFACCVSLVDDQEQQKLMRVYSSQSSLMIEDRSGSRAQSSGNAQHMNQLWSTLLAILQLSARSDLGMEQSGDDFRVRNVQCSKRQATCSTKPCHQGSPNRFFVSAGGCLECGWTHTSMATIS